MQAKLYFNSGTFQKIDIKCRKLLVLMSSFKNVKKSPQRGKTKKPSVGK
jgi:hypothetical protein